MLWRRITSEKINSWIFEVHIFKNADKVIWEMWRQVNDDSDTSTLDRWKLRKKKNGEIHSNDFFAVSTWWISSKLYLMTFHII